MATLVPLVVRELYRSSEIDRAKRVAIFRWNALDWLEKPPMDGLSDRSLLAGQQQLSKVAIHCARDGCCFEAQHIGLKLDRLYERLSTKLINELIVSEPIQLIASQPELKRCWARQIFGFNGEPLQFHWALSLSLICSSKVANLQRQTKTKTKTWTRLRIRET